MRHTHTHFGAIPNQCSEDPEDKKVTKKKRGRSHWVMGTYVSPKAILFAQPDWGKNA